MAKKSKKQQDDQTHDDEFVELPEDRLDQIEHIKHEDVSEKKPEEKPKAPRKRKQAQAPEEAPKDIVKKSESPRDDLLDDVRRSLAEEEVVEEPKGFFGRIKARLKKTSVSQSTEFETHTEVEVEPDTQARLEEPDTEIQPEKKKRTSKNKEEEKAIQEFFADLEALADLDVDVEPPPTRELQETVSEQPQPEEEVKVPKLPVKSDTKEEVDFEAVREVALQEYDETKIELEERKPQLREEVRQTIRELKPFERILLIVFGVLTVGVLFTSGIYLIANSISIPTPTPTVEINPSEIVHPTSITLPGGWSFNLGQGRVREGVWAPKGAEWLVGTEISRWIALPWSLQLEAVLRTLKSEDQIEVTMSNFDVLTFDVYSIQEMTMEKLLATDPTRPSLLVVLYNDEEADGSFWVVTALPSQTK